MNAEPCPLPADSLLLSYQAKGDFADCFTTDIEGAVTLAQFVGAFYTTPLFKLERLILKWLAKKPSTDDAATLLAQGETESFAAWTVEARKNNQLLMCDFQGRTRSWFMLQANEQSNQTTLYFGSAVVAGVDPHTGQKKMSGAFNALLGFHTLYSKLLLNAAQRRLKQSIP